MDRAASRETGESGALVLPSRVAALELCRAALGAEDPGPVLLTGEAGSGKTWLWNRLAADRAGGLPWLAVDLAPASEPADLHLALGLALGLTESGRTREGVAEALAEADDDGRRWGLVVDEAQNASAEVLEELRLLSNRLGRPGGFAALLMVGQTRIVRRLGTIPLAAVAARIAARAHLRPIDADEALDLLAHRFPGRTWGMAEVDHLHREAGGNPRRLIRLAAPIAGRSRPLAAPAARPALPVSGPAPAIVPASSRLGTARPPLRVEDGLIEVGWDGPDPGADPEADPASASAPSDTAPAAVAEAVEPAGEDEAIHDHYAALQAWNEWARNQGRQPAAVAGPPEPPAGSTDVEAPAGDPHVWADEQHGFAPYSQLFSRIKQVASPET